VIPESICHLQVPPNWRNSRTHFFKFMTRSTAEIVLRNRTLRWSTPAHLNDPHDNQFDFSSHLDRHRAKAETIRKLWENHYENGLVDPTNQFGLLIRTMRGRFPALDREEFYREFSTAIDETFDRAARSIARFNEDVRSYAATNKLLCLTERLDETLMWAYYAEAHSGVAIRFRSAPELDSVWGAADRVEYRDTPPALYDIDTFSDVMSGRASLDEKAILQRMALTKASSWSHEKEWRIFAGSGRDKGAPYEDIPFNRWELDAVILGCRMSDQDRLDIRSLVRRQFPHAHLFLACPRRADFGLTFNAID
jgi:hypothetical protein